MNKIALIGGTNAFREYLMQAGAEIIKMDDISQVIRDESFDGMILLPEYETGKEIVEQMSLKTLKCWLGENARAFGCMLKITTASIITSALCLAMKPPA